MAHAALVEVDNSLEDPDAGRQGLRDELLPALQSLPGFDSALLLTAYERGRGVAVVVFDRYEDAESVTRGIQVGQELRPGVTVTAVDVLEVTARG